MKILFTFLTYGVNIFGGVEKSIYNLIQGLMKINVKVIVYTGNMRRDGNDVNHKVYYSDYLLNDFSNTCGSNLNDAIIQNYETYNKQIKRELCDIIEKENPDYILAIDHIWGIIPYVDIFKDTTCPIGLMFHMLHEDKLVKKMFDYPFEHIFCVSNYVKNGLQKFNNKNRDIILCPNCITDEYFVRKNQLGQTKIFCNARMAEGKGIQCLIDAFIELLNLYPECKLYLCNGNFHFTKKIDVKGQIEEINKFLGEESIFLLPNLQWNDISRILHQMDLVVLPTEMETFGLGALETIASGIPLITTKVGNLPDLLQDAAFFINTITSDSIVETVKYVFNKREVVDEKVERGYQIAKNYLDVKVAAMLINYLRS